MCSYLTVADVPLSAASVERAFGQSWTPADAQDARPRSGRPGYVRGLPVLSGRAEDEEGGPVQPSTSGLVGLVSRRADGVCAQDAALPVPAGAGGGGLAAEGVLFGQDALLSCELGYDLATLRAKCEVRAERAPPSA